MHFGRFASRKSEAKYPSLWDGLVGAWCPSVQNPSGNTLYDLSGRNNHGTLTNMDSATDWVRGDGRGALDFDGVNDFVSLPDSTANLASNMSASFWFRTPTTSALNTNHVLGFYNGSSGFNGWAIDCPGTSALTRSISFWDGLGWRNANASNLWTADVLNHLVFSLSGTVATIYVNGNSVASISGITSGSRSYTGAKAIGARAVSVGNVFDGLIDDVLLYNRPLVPAEVRLLASQRGIAFTPKRRSIFRQLTNRLRSSRFAAFPA